MDDSEDTEGEGGDLFNFDLRGLEVGCLSGSLVLDTDGLRGVFRVLRVEYDLDMEEDDDVVVLALTFLAGSALGFLLFFASSASILDSVSFALLSSVVRAGKLRGMVVSGTLGTFIKEFASSSHTTSKALSTISVKH